MTKKLVIIDDEPDFAEMLGEMAQTIGFETTAYTNARDFFDKQTKIPDVIMLDLNMPDLDGVEVIRLLAEQDCASALLLISGYDSGVLHSAEQLVIEHKLNFITSLTKPIRMTTLLDVLSYLPKLEVVNRNRQTRKELKFTPTELKKALDLNELVLHFQPQLDLKSNSIYGVEALARWQHPEHGLIFPDQFIPLLEENDLMTDLTSVVLNMAVENSLLLQKRGFDLKLAVNVSADNITSLTLPEQLSDLVTKNKLNPAMVVLEITETALMSELVTSLDILTRLRMKGFGLSIDDFGTGYSSLSQLHRVPFTELKIDRSFVSKMDKDNEALAIVETCTYLGKKLKMKVVAEGVETKGILGVLREFGCDMAQGYYMSKPLPVDELSEWIKKH